MTLTHSTRTHTPTRHELMVAAALERLATDAAACAEKAAARAAELKRGARLAWGIGDDETAAELGRYADAEAKEASFFKRGRTAYTNALAYWNRGIRPEQLPSGAWILPSVASGSTPHLITKSGDWCCVCDAGAQMHWPIAMLIGLEIAGDEIDATDDAPLPFEPTLAEIAAAAQAEAAPMLASRAERRARIEAAASDWF